MSTQKLRQDPDATERQLDRQHRAARNRKTGVFAVVLAIVAALVAAYAITRGDSPEVPANPEPPRSASAPGP